MQDQAELIKDLFEKTTHYTETSAQLFRLKAIDKSADLISSLVARLAVVTSFVLCFLVLNIGVALWLGEVLEKVYYGFFIVGGFYVTLGVLLHFFRNRWIKKPLRNSIVLEAMN
ncbi:MAG TPA: phage holin family protein [Bacteroidia bacterium]|nr:phage holin family protein [Bacteroidia bacterium]